MKGVVAVASYGGCDGIDDGRVYWRWCICTGEALSESEEREGEEKGREERGERRRKERKWRVVRK